MVSTWIPSAQPPTVISTPNSPNCSSENRLSIGAGPLCHPHPLHSCRVPSLVRRLGRVVPSEHAANHLHDISSGHGPGLPAAQEPRAVPIVPAALREADVFYPVADADRCTAALLLDIDPVGLVRPKAGASGSSGWSQHYVNDLPYVASSHLSVAIARCSTVRWPAAPGTGPSWRNNRFHWRPNCPPFRPGRDLNSFAGCSSRWATPLISGNTPGYGLPRVGGSPALAWDSRGL